MKKRADGRFTKKKRVSGKQIFGYGATPELAQEDLEEKIREMESIPSIFLPENPTFHDVAKACWYPRIASKKDQTATRYLSAYRRHLRGPLGNLIMSEIEPRQIQSLVAALKIKVISPNGHKNSKTRKMDVTGVRFVIGVANQIFQSALANRIIDRNPMQFVDKPARKSKRERFIRPDRATEVLEMLEGDPLYLPVVLAMVFGCARGEVVALRWDHIERTMGEVRIVKQLRHTKDGVIEDDLKTGDIRKRTLMLPASMMNIIDSHGDLDHSHVCTFNRKAWRPNELTRQWKEFNDREKVLPGWTFHDLRHGAAGLIYAATQNILAVKTILGHARIDTTLIYTAEEAAQTEEAIRKLSQVIKL